MALELREAIHNAKKKISFENDNLIPHIGSDRQLLKIFFYKANELQKLELFCHKEVLIVMRRAASFLLFWQEQGQFCLDKPLDEYQHVSHEKPLIFNPALYLTKP